MALGKFLTVDPGENTGWSVWNGDDLMDSGQTLMRDFSDAVWNVAIHAYMDARTDVSYLDMPEDPAYALPEELREVADAIEGIDRVVIENWSLYPWELRTGHMDWDECRTARLIGSIEAACRIADWAYEQQPALIKERAIAAGAEAYFIRPLHENRHQNDAIMHGVYRNAKERSAPWTNLSGTSWIEDA